DLGGSTCPGADCGVRTISITTPTDTTHPSNQVLWSGSLCSDNSGKPCVPNAPAKLGPDVPVDLNSAIVVLPSSDEGATATVSSDLLDGKRPVVTITLSLADANGNATPDQADVFIDAFPGTNTLSCSDTDPVV